MIRIASDRLTAEIAPLGAELQSLRDTSRRDYLWNGDPAWWSGQAPILFPIIGELNGHHFRWHGRDYELQRHGFGRRRALRVRAR